MAKYNTAYEKLKRWEGGYSNHINDTGGETYKGITRKNYPNMSFWSKIDLIKKEGKGKDEINYILGNDESVENEVKEFYKKHYWNPFNGDEIECQEFAENVFLLSVNAGLKRGLKIGQQACDIASDGIYGKNTKRAFNSATLENVKKFNEIEIKFYEGLVEKNPNNKVFLKGWLNRAKSV